MGPWFMKEFHLLRSTLNLLTAIVREAKNVYKNQQSLLKEEGAKRERR
jgi:hypothetical protein